MTQPRPLPRETELSAHVDDAPGGDAYLIEIPTGTAKAEEIGIEATVDTITVALRSQSRVFEFPAALDTDRVRAEVKLGVLRIEAPKAMAGKRRVVRVEQAA